MKVDGAHFDHIGPRADEGLAQTAAQGNWRGETVTVEKSAASLLADAAEELTFAQAEREEEKDISERRVHAPPRMIVPELQQIMELLGQLGEAQDQNKLEDLVAKLRAGGSPRDLARAAFADVSQQFLALSYALHQFEGEGGNSEIAAALRFELQELHEDHGPAIRAGLNTAAAAHEHAGGDVAHAAELRECYRETVLGREGLAETYTSVLQRFGAGGVGPALNFLVRAVGDDLAARGPSAPPTELQSILEDLYHLQVLATVLEGCEEGATVLARDFGVARLPVETWMSRLVGLTGERWLTSDRFGAVARELGVPEGPAHLAFLQRSRQVLRDLPLKIFPDTETRDRLLAAAQEAIDLAIEEEE